MRIYHDLGKVGMLLLILVISFSASMLTAETMLSEAELEVLTQMLAEAELNVEHTGFYRDWDLSTEAKSSWHMEVLGGGLDALSKIDELRALMAERELDAVLNGLYQIAWDTQADFRKATPLDFKNPKALFRYVESSFAKIEKDFDAAFATLTDAQSDSLCSFLMQSMAEDEESCRQFLESRGLSYLEDIEIPQFIPLIKSVDWAHLAKAGAGMQRLQEQISEYRPQNSRIRYHKSRFGLMIMGSTGNDIYSSESLKALRDMPICLLIEPDGNDIYQCDFSTGKDHPFFIHIDHGGNDLYRSSEPSFFAFRGIGLSRDHEGDDIYQLSDFSFAAMLGIQVHIDDAGADSYRGGLFSQAAGIAGISILADLDGNDSYSAHAASQAFGSTLGVGLLADYAGADTYYLGGKYFHAPLMPDDYRTMGQGMGFGMRPHLAGGLGFLYDRAGNDKYLGGVYAQGVGYWYATGLLIDEGGNDVYNAIYYPQGSGIHMASGILYDHEGNDAYYSRHGPGQGAGHDWSFGLFIDAGGDDAYSIEGGNGLGLTNSLGIFVDRAGNDRYERQHPQSYGYANYTRNTGGIGLFLDAGGEDKYPSSEQSNNSTWQQGTYGLGRDLELYPTEEETAGAAKIKQDPPPSADAGISEIFDAAAEWEVGSAVDRVRAARTMLNERAGEAGDYILEHKLANDSGLEYRALAAFTGDNPDFKDLLLGYVNDSDSLKAKTAISLLAQEQDLRILPHLAEHIEAGRYLSTCISALAYLDDLRSLSLLVSLQDQEDERLRFLVARSLSLNTSKIAKTALEDFREDPSFLIQALIRKQLKEEL